jgi:uncharacterized caspase-like protein
VRLLLDGRPYPGAEHFQKFDPPRDGEVQETWDVKLEPGPHTLAVLAKSTASDNVSEPVHVTFGARGMARGVPDAAAASQSSRLFVLAVGISAYPGPSPEKLSYAAKDAEAIVRACQVQAGNPPLYHTVEVKTLTDGQATRKGIASGLAWLQTATTLSDVAVVAFAGHGLTVDGRLYLLPCDVKMDDVPATAVAGDELKRTLARLPARKVLLLLDACHSGAVDGGPRRDAPTDDLVRDLALDEYGVIAMCAATARESALESSTVEHGYFTSALTEGLAGKADFNQNHLVQSLELELYIKERVEELSGGKQHPVTSKPAIQPFPLTKP